MPSVAAISSAAAVDNFATATVGFSINRDFGSLPIVSSGNLGFSLPPGGAGQLLVAMIGFRSNATFAMPAGWTQIQQAVNADTTTGGQVSALMAFKVRAGGEPAPTFTRAGGSVAGGCLVGYTPSAGGLTFDTSSIFEQPSATTALAGTAITVASGNALVVALAVMGDYDITPSTTFVAAGLSAAAPPGVLVPGTSTPVNTGQWSDAFFSGRLSPTPRFAAHGWDLAGVPAGSTGAFSGTSVASSRSRMIAASFVRV